MLWSPCYRRDMPSSCTSPHLRGSSRYAPVRVRESCEYHAHTHASAAAGLTAVAATSIAHQGSDRAPCHQLCCGRATAAALAAAPEEAAAPQRSKLSARDLQSGPERTSAQSPLRKRTASHAIPRQRASLRARFAQFLGKANRGPFQCFTAGATRPSHYCIGRALGTAVAPYCIVITLVRKPGDSAECTAATTLARLGVSW